MTRHELTRHEEDALCRLMSALSPLWWPALLLLLWIIGMGIGAAFSAPLNALNPCGLS